MPNVPTMDDLYTLGVKAGETVCGLYFGSGDMGLEFKIDATPVTAADRAISGLVDEWRRSLFPELAIISEEGLKGERTGDPKQYWMLVDEVDGTWAYHLGIPVFSSLFALMRGNEVAMSVIVDPISHRIYTAGRGKGAYLNRKRIHAQLSLPKNPSVGIVAWPKRGINDMLIENMISGPDGGVSGALHRMGCVPIKMGTIGYVDAMVAAGWLSATIFPGSTLHDTAAGDLLVREAGGIASDLYGSPLEYSGTMVDGHVFSCNSEFHDKMLDIIKQARVPG